jgi:flagellar hook assembly protein FlgD
MFQNHPLSKEKPMKKAYLPLFALGIAGLLALWGCATVGGTIAPEVAAPQESWIAPRIPESSQRDLLVPLSLQLSSGAQLNGYRLTVFNESDKAVRTIEVKAAAPKRTAFGWKVPTVPAPSVLSWDGKNDAGRYVPDGTYTYLVEAWGEPGVLGRTQPRVVHVDNSYPSVELSVTYPFFSPGTGEGQQLLTIRQRNATSAPQWKGSFQDAAGRVVRSFSWSQSPKDLVWDGTDDSGKLLPDGQYSYRISAVNLAGTPRTIPLAVPLVIDTRAKEATLKLQYPAFSPDGPSPRRTITLSPSISMPDEASSWSLWIYDSEGKAVRTFLGTGSPQPVVFDGKDDSGRYVPDGELQAVLEVTYKTRADVKAVSQNFLALSTPPGATLSAPYRAFAPGMGKQPVLVVDMTADRKARWTGTILDGAGKSVYSTSWATVPQEWRWDGRDSAGLQLPDGSYRFRLSGVDAAENASSFELADIRIDTRAGHAVLSAAAKVFSPNGDRVKDTLTFSLGGDNLDSVAGWALTISGPQGADLRHITGEGLWTQPTYSWRGRGDNRRVLPDGTYNATLALQYLNGLTAVSDPLSVVLNAAAPKLSVTLSPPLFSPDETSVDKTLSIAIGYRDLTPATDYDFKIADPKGASFYEFKGPGVPSAPLKWDGRSASGELVQSAMDYPYTLSVQDQAGNTAVASGKIPIDILVLREGNKLRIDVPSINFEPWSAKLITKREDPVLYAQTQRAFDLLVPKLKKYPEHQIRIEGNAVRIFWFNDKLGRREEKQLLGPLSMARAQTVRQELIKRGIGPGHLSLAALGGTNPIVPFSDISNRWKDRRVEFILVM